MIDKQKIDNVVNTFGYWCTIIGIPLCVVGTSIVIFSGVFGKEQVIGTLISVSGVAITSLTLPCIVIKLMVGDVLEVRPVK